MSKNKGPTLVSFNADIVVDDIEQKRTVEHFQNKLKWGIGPAQFGIKIIPIVVNRACNIIGERVRHELA